MRCPLLEIDNFVLTNLDCLFAEADNALHNTQLSSRARDDSDLRSLVKEPRGQKQRLEGSHWKGIVVEVPHASRRIASKPENTLDLACGQLVFFQGYDVTDKAIDVFLISNMIGGGGTYLNIAQFVYS